MKINEDFNQRVVLDTEKMEWVPSPMAGVKRKMLDRLGAETGRATSLVRYAPGSYFSAHQHEGGEEFLVLDGVFSDETGDYPAGSYVRNPIGTQHKPFSDNGCIIFVKLWQFDPNDERQFSLITDQHFDGDMINVQLLHQYNDESVCMVALPKGLEYTLSEDLNGSEILILSGQLSEKDIIYPTQSWMRNPTGFSTVLKAEENCVFYLKTGHLNGVDTSS